jgi:hypothetical protein
MSGTFRAPVGTIQSHFYPTLSVAIPLWKARLVRESSVATEILRASLRYFHTSATLAASECSLHFNLAIYLPKELASQEAGWEKRDS